MTVHFDDSLPRLCELVSKDLGKDVLSRAAIVRDAGGRLSVVLPDPVDESRMESLDSNVRAELGAYARPDGAVIDARYPGAELLLNEAAELPTTSIGDHALKLLDRRIVGSEWLRPPVQTSARIPRIVFASLKGGVGRSTALCIVAAHLSKKGRRVLTIDFDLEAPGIGTMLLDESELPEYGVLDFLVEAGLSNVDESFFSELSGDSFLGAGGARVTVIPAIGRRTLQNPENALAKIARAYLESPQEDGHQKTITDHLSDLLARYEGLGAYDVILVDGRSGLHETTASLVLGIGAEVLLFGVDQPQTFQGYRLLVGQLSSYASGSLDDLRDRISFVQAKASDSVVSRGEASSKFQAVFRPLLAPELREPTRDVGLTENDFDLEWEESTNDLIGDDVSEVQVLYVLEDTRYRQFDPVADRRMLDARAYESAFGSLLEYVDSVVFDTDEESEEQQP